MARWLFILLVLIAPLVHTAQAKENTKPADEKASSSKESSDATTTKKEEAEEEAEEEEDDNSEEFDDFGEDTQEDFLDSIF